MNNPKYEIGETVILLPVDNIPKQIGKIVNRTYNQESGIYKIGYLYDIVLKSEFTTFENEGFYIDVEERILQKI